MSLIGSYEALSCSVTCLFKFIILLVFTIWSLTPDFKLGIAVLALMLIPGLLSRRMERKRTP